MAGNLSYPATVPTAVVPPVGGIQTAEEVRALFQALAQACRTVVQGREAEMELILTALFADGHVLLEDHTGSGKSTLATALGRSLTRSGPNSNFPIFKRCALTADSVPADLTGVSFYDASRAEYVFRPGPIFANIVLAEQIQSTSPRVQATLLDAMAEKQVTADNRTFGLEEIFFVIATQNPRDRVSTAPLTRTHLDRFLFKIMMSPLSREQELEVLARHQQHNKPSAPVATPEMLCQARAVIRAGVRETPAIREALVDIARATRSDRRLVHGISTRALVQAIPALQTRALIAGRDYVTLQDIKSLAVPLLVHRLEAVAGVTDLETVVKELVNGVLENVAPMTHGSSGATPPMPVPMDAPPLLLPVPEKPLPTRGTGAPVPRAAVWKGLIAGILG